MLPAEVVARLLQENDIVALRMKESEGAGVRDYLFRVLEAEQPDNLEDFSIGSASAQASAGTGWSEQKDTSNRYLLEPPDEMTLYQFFYGIWPAYAWVYRQYPTGVIHGSLASTITVGDRTYRIGKVDGYMSPYRTPSARTENFGLNGTHPAFLGFHPYLEPASITVYLNFFLSKLYVEHLRGKTLRDFPAARVRTVGGIPPINAPQWLAKLG